MTEESPAISDGSALLALALGVGGGLLLAYVRGRDRQPDGECRPERSLQTPTAPAERNAVRGTGGGACLLRLDATGLTVDGHRVDVAGAVARCKEAGRAKLVLGNDGSIPIYIDLCSALAVAGVPLRVSGARVQ